MKIKIMHMKKCLAAFTLAALSLFSCVSEREIDVITPTKNKEAQVVLRLKTPSGYSSPGSRSLTYTDENTISDIYVLVFDKTSTLVGIEQGASVTSSTGSSNPSFSGEGSFSVTLEASKTTVDTYNLVVLANAQSIISSTIGFDLPSISKKGYTDVMGAIRGQITGPMYSTGGTTPMWGESGQLVVEAGNSTQTLQLTRCVARIDVGVGNASKDSGTGAWTWDGKDASNKNIPFVLGHVYVIKPNNRYAVAPNVSAALGKATVPTGTTAFSVADSKAKFVFAATASSTGGYTSRDIYVPEADIEMGTSASVGDANHTNRMAIVVGGYYNGSTTETFYRLDFAVSGSLMNVLRNHLYQFSISSVSGNGFPDVETAYKSLSMNIAVKIREWNERDMGNIAFDGQNTLSVSQDSYSFGRKAITDEQDDNVLYVLTDYLTTASGGTSGWYVEKIVDASDGTTPVTWVALTPTSGAANVKAKVILTVSSTTQNRSAVIWIAAGRLRYAVTVTQLLNSALDIQIFNGNNNIVTELVFDGLNPLPQTLRVKWKPKDADLDVMVAGIGANPFPSETGMPTSGTIEAGNGGTGTISYTIQPPAFTAAELDEAQGGNPLLGKISKVDFVTSDGISYAVASVYLWQINYNLLTDVKGGYALNSQTETINVRANFGWKITKVTDTYDILKNENSLVGQTGGNNTSPGDAVRFTMQEGNTMKLGKTATITFTSLRDGSTWDVVIKAVEIAIYVGRFAGELVQTNGEWQFERTLYVQGGTYQDIMSSTENDVMQGGTSDTDGKTSTYNLHTNSYSNPAATLCYNKNTGAINSASDLVWYLPAQKQLMAVWVAQGGFENHYKLFRGFYWSATEVYLHVVAAYVVGSDGYTAPSDPRTASWMVRCVREVPLEVPL